jgi:hypothetical protein
MRSSASLGSCFSGSNRSPDAVPSSDATAPSHHPLFSFSSSVREPGEGRSHPGLRRDGRTAKLFHLPHTPSTSPTKQTATYKNHALCALYCAV